MSQVQAPVRPRPACTERGPGPAKYVLPGTCGRNFHDPTKVSKPAFSFGIKTKQSTTLPTTFNSPGPVHYISPDITKHGKANPPSFSLYGRTKPLAPGHAGNPSPDRYHIEDVKPLKTVQPPSFSFGYRTKYLKRDNVPSPNTYTLPPMMGSKIIDKKSSSAPSMTGRSLIGSFHQDFKKTPGPGTYDVVDNSVTHKRLPLYTLKGRVYPPSSCSSAPAPGTYQPEKVYYNKKVSPSYSFGIRHSDYLANLIEMGFS